jgi:hypothetical protein
MPGMAEDSLAVTFRTATLADLDGILAVEQSWPEAGRAGADKFIARIKRFPQGFFLASVAEAGRERIVGTITSMPTRYDPSRLGAYRDWQTVTNDGYLFENVDTAACNALYIVSGVIDTQYRGLNIFQPGVLVETRLARDSGLRYIVAGAVIPGYRRYCERFGDTDPYVYAGTRRGKQLIDPLLAMYEGIGFSVPSREHVIAGYFPDDASRNYAALVVRDLEKTPL